MDQDQNGAGQAAGPSKNAKIITAVAVLLVAVLLVFGIRAFTADNTASTTNSGDTTSSTGDNPSGSGSSTSSEASGSGSSSAASSDYEDGSYTATGSYATPEGTEEITVKITLANGAITDSSATATGRARESRQYQSQFISAYKDLVVGKSIDKVSLSRVSGSSLTSTGFNKAIESIKEQANS